MTGPPRRQTLTLDNINPCLKTMEYAVRGPLLFRCNQIEKELVQGVMKPYKSVIRATFGDAQALGQPPITFLRQVLATVSYPHLLNDPNMPDDVKKRAKLLLSGCRGQSVGAYTDSPGIEVVRQHAAEFIEKRDGCPSSVDNIFLFNGAGEAIRAVLKLFTTHDPKIKSGVLTPVPQYPVYNAQFAEYDIRQIDYYLDESKGWGTTVEELKRAITEGRKFSKPRAIVIINPGNPTGQVLTKKNIEEIIKFAYEEHLLILADEVYQENIYDKSSEFHSFKKVMFEMGPPYSDVELASFMTCSKGFYGECGLRGGYAEIHNFDRDVQATFMRVVSAMMCSNVLGMVALDCVLKPPQQGDPSYPLFQKEKKAIRETLGECAKLATDTFNSVEGISCNAVQGALYAFPKLHLPSGAIKAAKNLGILPDQYYCSELLEKAGVCVVAGSGFGQEEGTWHIRLGLFSNTQILQELLTRFIKFHTEFLRSHQ